MILQEVVKKNWRTLPSGQSRPARPVRDSDSRCKFPIGLAKRTDADMLAAGGRVYAAFATIAAAGLENLTCITPAFLLR